MSSVEVPPVANMAGLLGRPVPENIYGTLTHNFIPRELGRVLPATENYVTHIPVTSKVTHFFHVVTDSKIYKVSDTLSKKRDVWDMKEIKDIIGTDEGITIKLLAKVSSDEVTVKSKPFEGDGILCQALPFIFANRSRILWQSFTEAKLIPEPEIYQCHFFVGYQESPKKKFAACLLISSKTLYVCSLKGGLPALIKEKFPADRITGISTVPGNERAIKVSLGAISPVCITSDIEDCNALAYELRRLVWDTRKANIAIQQPSQP